MDKSVEEILDELMLKAIVEISQDDNGVHFFNSYGDELFCVPFAKGAD